ncbi:hypothetical protein IX299_001885 [Porphyromonas levii]|nr:hypothetical protein [Porphyromonas levii]
MELQRLVQSGVVDMVAEPTSRRSLHTIVLVEVFSELVLINHST